MGVVYTAQDPRLKRQVAIKLLTADLTRDETAKQRFLQEAQPASALDHPNICTIYEINETDDGQLYLVMAYYEGETLKQRIERGPLALNEAVDIATQVGRGLAWAGSTKRSRCSGRPQFLHPMIRVRLRFSAGRLGSPGRDRRPSRSSAIWSDDGAASISPVR